MRRSDQPNRPNTMTCCFFSSFKTLLTSTEGNPLAFVVNVLDCGLSLAGFQVIIYGRFWVFTEAPTFSARLGGSAAADDEVAGIDPQPCYAEPEYRRVSVSAS